MKKPPQTIVKANSRGKRMFAMSMLGEKTEMAMPMACPQKVVRMMQAIKMENCWNVCDSPIMKYVITPNSKGEMT
jgi:hypothetical protein